MEPLPALVEAKPQSRVAAIVRESGERLRRFVRARVRSEADAEDVLQDVWQRLVTALEDGPIEQVGAWLYTVARNRIVDRSRRPAAESLDALAEEAELPPDAFFELPGFALREDRTPASEHARALFWERLQEALAELPPEQRQVFVWHELEDLSFREMAAATGENRNTLLARKRYAVLHLRRRLAPLRDELRS